MALTNASNRVVASGDGVTTTFAYNRLLYDTTHLQVYIDDDLQSTGYTVSGVPGTSTSINFSVAPTSIQQVLMLRVVPLTQLSVYAVGGAFPAATTEKNLDLLMMGLQQFDETLDRAVTLPVSSTLTATNLPDPALPANYGAGIKIKGDGTGLDTFAISATPFASVVTTKGDIAIFGASAVDRLPIGLEDTMLRVDSGSARGMRWADQINCSVMSFEDGADPSKTVVFDISPVSVSTARTWTAPDASGIVALITEGSWTPSVGGSATYTSRTGTYKKIGNMVTVQCDMLINAIGTGSTSVIAGLPFTISGVGFGTVVWDTAAANYTCMTVNALSGTTTAQLNGATAAAASLAVATAMGNATRIQFTLTYFV